MMNEWSDRLPPPEAAELWRRSVEQHDDRLRAQVERELRNTILREGVPPTGFYDAMRHFLTLREKFFPHLPADPAWKILVTLAQTPEGSPKSSMSGIAHGADVPLTTALRYVAAMEVAGIARRVRHPNDGRQVMIQLTDEGRRRLDAIAEQWATRLLCFVVPVALLCYAVSAMMA